MTSSFKRCGNDPRAVSIARYPMFFKGRRYCALAPSVALFRAWKTGAVSNEDYTERFYRETLSGLDPALVLKDLGEDAILLCWCPPGEFCHRRLVARWLEEALGISVQEVPV